MASTPAAQLFYEIGEYFAAGFFELEEASNARRFCRAYRRLYENCPLMEYPQNAPLYPPKSIRADELAVSPQYCRQFSYNRSAMEQKSEKAAEIFNRFCDEHERFWEVDGAEEVFQHLAYLDAWNHAALNHKRITAEGLDGYEKRIRAMKNEDLKAALLDVMEGIRAYHRRSLEYLISVHANEKLIEALKKVPFSPAETAYEAMVSAHFMFCFDGCDNIGHVDSWLNRYWKGEDLTDVMHCMMKALQDSDSWSLTIGPKYCDLTKQWMKASRGLARPMVELLVTDEMPDDIWQTAIETVLSGGAQPSFYNDRVIRQRLHERLPEASEEDLGEFAGAGCTETTLSGLTFCGGIDANLNVLKVFEECMREDLQACRSFDEFYSNFFERLHRAQDALMKYVDTYYKKRAEISFAPIRTLFTDDCIEKEKGFYEGGARYNYAMPADSGIPNTVDSLLAVKHLVFERKRYSAEEFLSALDKDDPILKAELKTCPSYGVCDPEADALIRDLTGRFYSYYRSGKLTIGSGFLPTSHQFLRHVGEGKTVGNTPDGRHGGQPVADSIAAVNGKAVKGPTSMLISAVSFLQNEIYGIPVLNLSINRKFDPAVLRALIESYFEMDGTQIQITCTTAETLLDAQKNPDAHRDLVVRIGGYSDYFCNIGTDLQNAVIARTMFE